jgi:hypothetical protein
MVFFAASALNAETILYLFNADPIKIGVYVSPLHAFLMYSKGKQSLPSGAGQIVGGGKSYSHSPFCLYLKRMRLPSFRISQYLFDLEVLTLSSSHTSLVSDVENYPPISDECVMCSLFQSSRNNISRAIANLSGLKSPLH